jgi:hypothetical protein
MNARVAPPTSAPGGELVKHGLNLRATRGAKAQVIKQEFRQSPTYSRRLGAFAFAWLKFCVATRLPTILGMSRDGATTSRNVALLGANAVSTALALAAPDFNSRNRATILPACKPMPIHAPLSSSAPFAIAFQGSAI